MRRLPCSSNDRRSRKPVSPKSCGDVAGRMIERPGPRAGKLTTIMNIVCIVLDRLHWGYLGCYGNTWVATPALDRLAAEGFVFAQALAESTDLGEAYDCLWCGTSVLRRRAYPNDFGPATLAEHARQSGRRTILVTDESLVAGHAAGAAFDEAVELEPPSVQCDPADDASATFTARIFSEAIDRTMGDIGGGSPFFLWLHARAMGGPWDAPRSFRERYAEEDDPPPPDFTTVPHEILPADVDLDRRFGIAQAYAGQVTLVDACLGGFLEHLEESGLAASTAVVLLAPRGIALGEHGAVGMFDDRLHSELVQTPAIVRLPAGRGRLRRSQALVQTSDWYHTLAELLEERGPAALSSTPESAPRSVLPLIDDPTAAWRDRALVVGSPSGSGDVGEFGIRTPVWYLRTRLASAADAARDAAGDHQTPRDQLFVKPDDAWEANDVADRCRDIVEMLHVSAEEYRTAVASGTTPAPLPEELLRGAE